MGDIVQRLLSESFNGAKKTLFFIFLKINWRFLVLLVNDKYKLNQLISSLRIYLNFFELS